MKTRLALPGLVILFSTAAIALMSVSVRTTRADDTQLQAGTTDQAAVVGDHGVPYAQQSAPGGDRGVAKPATPMGVQANRNTPTPTPAAADTTQSGCCG
jgi:hypothetical protein